MIRVWLAKYQSMPKTLRTSLLLTVCGVLQKGIQFIVVPVYTRIMPTESYGQYSVFLSWYQLITVFATLNLWNYLTTNGMSKYENDRDGFLSGLQGLSTSITLLWLLAYLVFRRQWYSLTGLSMPLMLVMFLELLVMPSFEYWSTRKRYEYDAAGVVVLTVALTVLTPLVSIPFILWSDDKGAAAILGRAGVSIGVYLIPFFILLRKGKKLWNREYWRYALKFNIPLLPHFLSMMVLQQSDRIMIERMCGESQAAVYSLAYSAAVVLLLINSSVLGSFVPYTYQSIKAGNVQKIFRPANQLLTLIGGLNLMVILVAPEMIRIMGPAEYSDAIYIIPPVAMSNCFMFLFNLFANIEYYYEETHFVTLASFVSAVINLILNYVCIQWFGYIAAGYTTLLCYIIFSFCHYLFMRKVARKYMAGIRVYNMKAILLICGSCLGLAAIAALLYPYVLLRYGIILTCGGILLVKRRSILNIVRYGRNDSDISELK